MGQIIRYNENYYAKLESFYYSIWPDRDRRYLKYRLYVFPNDTKDSNKNILVIDDKDQIIGCHLFFPTKALINGIETDIYWGHDTFLKQEYRGDLGAEFMMEQDRDILPFGAGLSALNYKIQKKIKRPFLGIIHNYVKANLLTPLSVLFRHNKTAIVLNHCDTIKVHNMLFQKITNVSELSIPNNGYWLSGTDEIEFIRDKNFIDKRFFKIYRDYSFYVHTGADGITDMYFVVSIKQRKNLPVLTIVDFRYTNITSNAIGIILQAANQIATKNFIPFTVLATTLHLKRREYTFMLKDNKCACVVGPLSLKTKKGSPILFNLADSDQDFV